MVANIVNKECKILKDLIFIEILHKISNEHIRFKQTRSQSLLIDQSLVQSYKLRNLFITIAKLNNIEWEIPGIKVCIYVYCVPVMSLNKNGYNSISNYTNLDV